MSAEPLQHHGLATVWTSAEGAPQRLIWSARRFLVISKPIAWAEHQRWWESSARVPQGASGHAVERAMWQVQAKALDNGELLIFDLAVSEGCQWPVTGIHD